MTSEDQRELEAALAVLEDEDLDAAAPRARDTRDRQDIQDIQDIRNNRNIVELIGLLPSALAPLAPPPHLKEQLLRRIAAQPTPVRAAPALSSPLLFPRPRRTGARRAPLLLAIAASVLVAIALAALSVTLLARLEEQERRVARLESELAERTLVPTLEAELAELRADLAVMTATSVEVCALETRDPDQPRADGVVYMSPGGGRWVLAAQGLAPSPAGRSYRIWFLGDNGVVKGGDFHVTDGHSHIHFCADAMPSETKAIMITLEPESGGGPQPSGQAVLYGQARQLL
jgi:hypothetical protein